MNKHKLLIYEEISRRMRGILFWLGVVLIVLALYDLVVRPVLGPYWFLLWPVSATVWALWLYYAVFVRRAALHIRASDLMIQGSIFTVRVSYGRIQAVTSTYLHDHYPPDETRGRERSLLEPFYGRPCLLVELHSFPKTFRHWHLWFPRTLLSTTRQGLLLIVEDWMSASQDIEAARLAWREVRGGRLGVDKRTLAARVLDADLWPDPKKTRSRTGPGFRE